MPMYPNVNVWFPFTLTTSALMVPSSSAVASVVALPKLIYPEIFTSGKNGETESSTPGNPSDDDLNPAPWPTLPSTQRLYPKLMLK